MLVNNLIYAHKTALIRGFNALYNNYNMNNTWNNAKLIKNLIYELGRIYIQKKII